MPETVLMTYMTYAGFVEILVCQRDVQRRVKWANPQIPCAKTDRHGSLCGFFRSGVVDGPSAAIPALGPTVILAAIGLESGGEAQCDVLGSRGAPTTVVEAHHIAQVDRLPWMYRDVKERH